MPEALRSDARDAGGEQALARRIRNLLERAIQDRFEEDDPHAEELLKKLPTRKTSLELIIRDLIVDRDFGKVHEDAVYSDLRMRVLRHMTREQCAELRNLLAEAEQHRYIRRDDDLELAMCYLSGRLDSGAPESKSGSWAHPRAELRVVTDESEPAPKPPRFLEID